MSLPEQIETPRLLLRLFTFSDTDDVLAYANDPEWSRYTLAPYPYGRHEAEQFIARSILEDRSTRCPWAVVYSGRVVGGVNIRLDLPNRVAELGWSIARSYWGKGLATEAARAILDRAFESYPDLNRIRAHADARNHASLRVMEKLGMTREGCLRQNRVLKRELIDEVCFGILRSEWQAGRTPRSS